MARQSRSDRRRCLPGSLRANRSIATVREAIRFEPLLDEQLALVLAAPLGFGAAE